MPRIQLTITVYYPDMLTGPVDDARPREAAWNRLDADVNRSLRRLHEIAHEELNDPVRGISCMIQRSPGP